MNRLGIPAGKQHVKTEKNEKITSAEWVIVSLKYLIEYTHRSK